MLFYMIGRNICAWEVEGVETWYSGFSGFLLTVSDGEISWDSEDGQGFEGSAFIDHNGSYFLVRADGKIFFISIKRDQIKSSFEWAPKPYA